MTIIMLFMFQKLAKMFKVNPQENKLDEKTNNPKGFHTKFFFVQADEYGGSHTIESFMPAKTFNASTSPYFGGYTYKELDLRPFKELKKQNKVLGLWMREGGSDVIEIQGKDLFATEFNAQEHVKNGGQPASIKQVQFLA